MLCVSDRLDWGPCLLGRLGRATEIVGSISHLGPVDTGRHRPGHVSRSDVRAHPLAPVSAPRFSSALGRRGGWLSLRFRRRRACRRRDQETRRTCHLAAREVGRGGSASKDSESPARTTAVFGSVPPGPPCRGHPPKREPRRSALSFLPRSLRSDQGWAARRQAPGTPLSPARLAGRGLSGSLPCARRPSHGECCAHEFGTGRTLFRAHELAGKVAGACRLRRWQRAAHHPLDGARACSLQRRRERCPRERDGVHERAIGNLGSDSLRERHRTW